MTYVHVMPCCESYVPCCKAYVLAALLSLPVAQSCMVVQPRMHTCMARAGLQVCVPPLMLLHVQVKELCAKLVVVVGQDALSIEAQRNATIMFFAMVRC